MLRFHTGWREFCATLGQAPHTDSDSFTDEDDAVGPTRRRPQGYLMALTIISGRAGCRSADEPNASTSLPAQSRSPNMFGSAVQVSSVAASHGHVELHTVQQLRRSSPHSAKLGLSVTVCMVHTFKHCTVDVLSLCNHHNINRPCKIPPS